MENKLPEVEFKVVGRTDEGEEIVQRVSPITPTEAFETQTAVQAKLDEFLDALKVALEKKTPAAPVELGAESSFYERMAGPDFKFRPKA